jgi:hypothetical protein
VDVDLDAVDARLRRLVQLDDPFFPLDLDGEPSGQGVSPP